MLINPPRVNGFPVVREERFEHKDIGSVYPPLSLLYLSAILEKEPAFEVKLLDANGFSLSLNRVNSEITDFSPDMVISRTGFDTQKEDLKIFHSAKDNGAFTVLRNKIISDVPEIRDKILKENPVDIFINSEPETVIMPLALKLYENKKSMLRREHPTACLRDPGRKDTPPAPDLLKHIKGISFYSGGAVHTTEHAENINNLDSLPFPAYHLLPSLDVYHTGILKPPFALVATTRGCPFGCSFCAYGKTKLRYRSVDSVIKEISYLKERFRIRSFLFFDDTISMKQGRTRELAEKITEAGLSAIDWVCCTRANLVDFETLKLMKQAGMKEIAIGIETGSPLILKKTKKGVSLDDIRQAAKWCRELNIMFYALVIIGLPGETKKTVNESIKFIKEIDPFYTQFCFAVPFPNTDIYRYYKDNGLLLTENYEKYFPLSDDPVVRTKELTAEDLKKLRRRAYIKTLLRPAYLIKKIRPFDLKWNILGAGKILSRILAVLRKKPVR